MSKSAKQRVVVKNQKLKRNLFLISVIALLVKFILILSIHNGGWLGADGESYLKGANGLLKDGLLSKDSILIYWPAGYPILIWIFALISLSKVLAIISFFQSVVYFVACAYFVEKLRQTRLSRLAVPTAFILALNPTLSLSSLVLGYESLVASCLILTVALIIHSQQQPDKKTLFKTLPAVALLQGFSAFLQPRLLLIGFFILLIWALNLGSRKKGFTLVVTGLCLLMILPAGLIVRNIQANGVAAISTNLGVTMSVGAGDKATGGYGNSGGIPCTPKPPATTVSDNQKVQCVITWYLHHPLKTVKLAINKSVFFWSPWSGPIANGTMARNPWLKIDPIVNIARNQQGRNLVYGWFGKLVSWIWLLGGLFLLFFGLARLWQLGGLERLIALLAGIPVLLTWLTSLGTIGDHRFRLPTMGLSLFLQVAGIFALKRGPSLLAPGLTLEGKHRAR